MLKIFTFFNTPFNHNFSFGVKPRLVLENAFELDPTEFLAEFSQKIKSLDQNNWLINDNLDQSLFELWFRAPTLVKSSKLTTVWNSKKIKIKYCYTYIDGFQADVYEFFHENERVLTLQKIKDYGKNYKNCQEKIKLIEPTKISPQEIQPFFLQNRLGDGIILEKFGHTQRWWIENWFILRQIITLRIQTS